MSATGPSGEQYLKWRGDNPKPEPGVLSGPPLPAFPIKPFQVELVFVDDESFGYLKIVKEDPRNTVNGFLQGLVKGESLRLMGVPYKEVRQNEHFLYCDGKAYRRVKVEGLHEDGYTILVLDVDTLDDLKCSARELFLVTREVISYPVEVFRCELNELEIFKGTSVVTDIVPNIPPQTYNCHVKISKEIPLVRLTLRDGSGRTFADLVRNEVPERCKMIYPALRDSARVVVTFADKWGNIWFQYPSVLMDNIRKYFETLDPTRMASLDSVSEYMSNPSKIFIGKWEGMLCRLRILKLRSFGKVKVDYIDYGNKGLLLYDDIYPLHSSEANIGVIPPQCLKIHLSGISQLVDIDRFWEHIDENVWIKIITPEPADSVEGVLCTPSSKDKGKAKPALENFNKKLLTWTIGSTAAGEDLQSPEGETFQYRLPTVQEQTEEESPIQTNNIDFKPKAEKGTASDDTLVNEAARTEHTSVSVSIVMTRPKTPVSVEPLNCAKTPDSESESVEESKEATAEWRKSVEGSPYDNINCNPNPGIRTAECDPVSVVDETTTEEQNPDIPETSARSSSNMQVVVHNNNAENSLDVFRPRVVQKVIQTSGASWKFGVDGQFTYCTGLNGSRLPVLDGGVEWTDYPKSDTTCKILVTQYYPETDELTLQVYNSVHLLEKLERAMNEYYGGIPNPEDAMPVEWLSLGGLYALYSTDLGRWVRTRALAISHSGRGTDPWTVTVRLLDYGYFVTALLPDLQLLRPLLPIFCYLKFQGFTATLYVDNCLKCGPIPMENPVDVAYKVHVVKRQESPERDVPKLKIVFISSFPLSNRK